MADRMEKFIAVYEGMADEQLVELAAAPDDLMPEARAALWAELGRRGLTDEALRASQRPASPPHDLASAKPDAPAELPDGVTPSGPAELVVVFSSEETSEAERAREALLEAGIESKLQVMVLVSPADAEGAFQTLSEQLETDPQ